MEQHDARARLTRLQAERSQALALGIENPSPYITRLEEAIADARTDYVMGTVLELALRRGSLRIGCTPSADGPGRRTWDDGSMSRRDLAHVMAALWELSGGQAGVAVPAAAVEESIGRGRGDMRTALDLRSLAAQGHVVAVAAGGWALTPAGVDWVVEDRELSDP